MLQELVTWLTASSGGDSKARVVTGKPGSGKSAVLGQLVILSDPEHRAKALSADAPAGTVPPQGCIDVSVHARGMTVADVVDTIALAAEVEAASPEDLLLGLQDQDRRLVVVVDAVDEAAAPDELASKLLNPLAATHGTGIRLLVGTRPHVLYRLGTAIEVLDLDDPAYLDPADLVEYTRRCLLLEGDPDVPTPYRGQPVVAAQVAEAVAARAHPLFLIAWLVSQSLIAAKTVVDVHEPRWQERLPSDVGQAMQGYLDQFKAKRARVRTCWFPWRSPKAMGWLRRGCGPLSPLSWALPRTRHRMFGGCSKTPPPQTYLSSVRSTAGRPTGCSMLLWSNTYRPGRIARPESRWSSIESRCSAASLRSC